jgi:hypothetical protein
MRSSLHGNLELLPADTRIPGSVPLATLAVSPADLARTVELSWTSSVEELGMAQVAGVELTGSGARFVVMAYDERPDELTVLGKPGDAGLVALLAALGVSDGRVVDRAADFD